MTECSIPLARKSRTNGTNNMYFCVRITSGKHLKVMFDDADSKQWRKKKEAYPSFFNKRTNFVLGTCADGVDVFDGKRNKGTGSIFAMVLWLFNLPADIRVTRDTIMTYGIFDHHPVDSNLLYKIMVEDFYVGWQQGFWVWNSKSDAVEKVKAMLLLGVFDYRGFADAIRHMHCGVTLGCSKCTVVGE